MSIVLGMDGKKFREIRERLGESQAKFALRFRVSRQTIHHWEQRNTPHKGLGARYIDVLIEKVLRAVPPVDKEKGGG
jgi:DNA-binding transcriptional regulator YiaG